MAKQMIKKLTIVVFYTAWSVMSFAQDFRWKATLTGIESVGFQKVQLSPLIVSKLSSSFGDIRIIDGEGKEVPYIFKEEQPFVQRDHFEEYKIIDKKELTSWPFYTRIVLQNPSKNQISNISLVIKNSDVCKKLKLSGSDDNSKWYIIKDNYRFQAMYSDNETSVIQIIDFPLSNYAYYEILIDDWKNKPINVLKAGYFNTSVEKGKYSMLEKAQINQTELKGEKESLVKLSYPEAQLFHKIQLKIDGPEFYYRNAIIQVRDSMIGKRNKYETYFKTVANIIISSNSLNTYYFDALWAKELFIRVSNNDDQALKISEVVGGQLNHYLICKLHSSKIYDLVFGNQKIEAPIYDLKYFSDEIPENLPVLTASNIELIDKANRNSAAGGFLDKKIIWLAIGLVVILLIFMVSKMLKEMKASKNE
jgi:hypothetical protein